MEGCWIGGLIVIYVQDCGLIALYFTQVKPGKSGTIQNINLRKSPPEYATHDHNYQCSEQFHPTILDIHHKSNVKHINIIFNLI